MKNMMIVLLAALSFAAVGCKKKGGNGEAMAKMTEFKDKMCACADTACATKVSEEMSKWSADQAKDQKERPTMSEEDTKKATQIGEEMGKCMQKAMGAGMAAPDSPAGADPAGAADPAAAGAADPAAAGAAGSADPAAAGAAGTEGAADPAAAGAAGSADPAAEPAKTE